MHGPKLLGLVNDCLDGAKSSTMVPRGPDSLPRSSDRISETEVPRTSSYRAAINLEFWRARMCPYVDSMKESGYSGAAGVPHPGFQINL